MLRYVVVVVIGAVLVGPAAAALVVDRVQVGVAGRKATSGFSAALAVALAAPPKHERSCCYDGISGAWRGPEFQATRNPGRRDSSSIQWSMMFRRSSAEKYRSA